MTDFIEAVLIKDSRIDNIRSTLGFGVFSGASSVNYQQYGALSQNANQMVFNCQIPSEQTLIDRNVMIQATYKVKLIISNVAKNATAFNYGLGESFQAFPIHSSIKNMTSTINNVSTTVNTQDILQSLLKMIDPRELQRYNAGCPSMPDLYFNNYADSTGTAGDPTADYKSAGYDNLLLPRGSHPLKSINVVHNITAGGTDASLVSTNVLDTFIITLESQFTEPLMTSPFLFGGKNNDTNQALFGITCINLVINLDTSLKRFFSTNNTGNISIAFDETNPITDAKLLFTFLNIQETDKLPKRNIVNYIDYPVFVSADTDTIAPNATKTIISNNYNLNQIPDLLIVSVRRPMASMTIKNTNSFLPIRNISINFNNTSGLLSTATPSDLFRLSKMNGSVQTFYEFWGYAGKTNTTPAVNTLANYQYPTSGSLLVLNPAKDLGLPYYLSNSSIGNYNIQFKIDVINNTTDTFIPEIVILTANSGILVNGEDNSDIYTGLLTRELIVNAVVKQDGIPSSSYNRLVGGGRGDSRGDNKNEIINDDIGVLSKLDSLVK